MPHRVATAIEVAEDFSRQRTVRPQAAVALDAHVSYGGTNLPMLDGPAYLVRVDIKPKPGIAVFLVSAGVFRGKSGVDVVIPVDAAAKAASRGGSFAHVDRTIEGYDTVTRCSTSKVT